MLTLFTIPKPFHDHIGVIQRNAIRSWTLLHQTFEIILFGNEEGTAETAARFGLRHIPDLACNKYGTPLVNDLFEKAQRLATHDLLCYVNADIILMNDFADAVKRIKKRHFLIVGQRWLLDLNKSISFDDLDWESWLRAAVAEQGVLDRPDGIDYFVFPRGLYKEIPPFAIGRTAWDNWLVYRARLLGISVIDVTQVVKVVHQNHDYSHHPQGTQGVWKGPESKRNLELAGGLSHVFTLHDASWILGPRYLRPALTYTHLRRRRDTLPIMFPQGGFRSMCLELLLSICLSFYVGLPRLRPHRLAAGIVRRAKLLYGQVTNRVRTKL